MRIEESIEIARPPAEVWAVVADPGNDPRWCPKVRSVDRTGPQRWQVTHQPVPLRPPVELELEHVACDEGSRLVMREADRTATFEVEYRLAATGAGTRFTQVSDVEWTTLPRFLRPVFERGVRRDVRRQLRELKRLVEAA